MSCTKQRIIKAWLLSIICAFSSLSYSQSWLDYYDSAQNYWGKDWNKSTKLLHEALTTCRTEIGTQNRTYAVLLNDLAIGESNLNHYALADSFFTESLKVKKLLLGRHNNNYLTGSLNLAEMRIESGNFEGAEKVYRELHNLYKKDTSKFKNQYITSLKGFSDYHAVVGNYKVAEGYLVEVSDLLKRQGDEGSSQFADVIRSIGDIQTQRGQYNDAIRNITHSVGIYENLQEKDNRGYLRSLNSLGVLFISSGQLQNAEPLFLKVKRLLEDNEQILTLEYAEVLNNLGSAYRILGNLQKAADYFNRSIAIYKNLLGETSSDYVAIISNQAEFFALIDDYSTSDSLYQISLRITESTFGRNHPLFSQSLNNMATLSRKFGNYGKAETYYQEALDIAKTTVGEESPGYATTLGNLGLLYFSMGQFEKSEKTYLKALTIQQKVLSKSHPSLAKTLNNLAILYNILEDSKAKEFFLEALNNQLNQINTIFPNLSDQEKGDFYGTLKLDIERFNAFALSNYKTDSSLSETLYNNQLKTKALLLNSLNKIRNSILTSSNDSLVNQFNRWIELREKIAEYSSFTKDDLNEEDLPLNAVQEQANNIEKYLSAQSELFSASDILHDANWKDIRAQLKPNEAAVEIIRINQFEIKADTIYFKNQENINYSYGFSDKVLYAFLILRGDRANKSPELLVIDYGKDLESRFYSYYSKTIKFQIPDTISYEVFWQPLKKHLAGVEHLYLSPDGIYNKLNLNAIFQHTSKKYIIDEMDIDIVTNTRDLLHRGSFVQNTERTAILVGNPQFDLENTADFANSSNISIKALPGSEEEVNVVHRILKSKNWKSTKLIAANATEETLRNIKNPSVLHLATHGFFSAKEVNKTQLNAGIDDPLFNSGLLLSGAENTLNGLTKISSSDGILTAYETMNMRLEHTDLVVLSACETGLGEIKNGEGVYGLQRAIKVAGANALIFSLWKVDDTATKELFSEFYKHWQSGMNKRQAFRTAQLALREREQYANPYYWAGFSFIGE